MQIATDAAASWAAARPEVTRDFQHDADVHSKFWLKGYDLLDALPEKPKRNPEQARAAETILTTGRATREAFLRKHVPAALRGADQKPDALRARRAARLRGRRRSFPACRRRAGRSRRKARRCSRAKDGIEIDQGIFFANVLTHAGGRHAFLPRDAAAAATKRWRAFPSCTPKARSTSAPRRSSGAGKASYRVPEQPALPQRRGRGDAAPTETAVDLALLDPASEIARAARRHGRQSEICRPAAVLAPASTSRISIAA